MRISDWSSDVCSSDLADLSAHPQLRRVTVQTPTGPVELVAPPVEIRGCAFDLGAVPAVDQHGAALRKEFARSEEHTPELQSLMRISYAVFCLKKKIKTPTSKTLLVNRPTQRHLTHTISH